MHPQIELETAVSHNNKVQEDIVNKEVEDETSIKTRRIGMRTKEYLGDGVYAEFDGYGIWLKANNYENPTDKIYLEPSVLETFDLWRKALAEC